MILFIGNLLDQLFGKTVRSVARAAETKLRRETIGKAEAKITGAGSKMTQKALRGMDKATDAARDKVVDKAKKK